ncbi:MAG: F0F1 ATP synthase subunit A [Phycisphaerae bacterium]|nr:F0F1 ATP synthase subunit A [Phycisphaerae bacterium]
MNVAMSLPAGVLPLAGVNVLGGTVAHRLWSHPLFYVMGKPVYFSSDILMLLLSAGLMLAIFPTMAQRLKKHPVPTGFRNFFEAMLVFLQRDTFEPMLGKWASVFTPYLWTAFFFILFADLFGMLPVDELVTLFNAVFGTHIPAFWGDATGNLTVTATLAVCTFLTVHVSGLSAFIRHARRRHQAHVQEHGHGHHVEALPEGPRRFWLLAVLVGAGNYLKHLVPPGVPWVIWPLIFVLELLGMFVKPLALCMRLFAVMMSGPLVVAVLVSITFALGGVVARTTAAIPIIFSGTAFEALHLLEAFLQAYIFTLLSAAYLAEAVSLEH